MPPEALNQLSWVELQNLLLLELREFVSALERESAAQLDLRKQRVQLIDQEILRRKNTPHVKDNATGRSSAKKRS